MTKLRVSPKFATWLKDFKAINQFHTGVIAAFDRDCEQCRLRLSGKFAGPAFCKASCPDQRRSHNQRADHFRAKPRLFSVLNVALHAQGQGFDAHQGVVRALWVHGHAQIAQTNCDRVEREGHRAKVSANTRPW